MIRSTLLAGYSALTRALGGHPTRLLRASGINPRAETDPDSYVSFSALCDLLERTATETGCDTFGLRLSEAQGIDSLGPLGFAMQNCDTVREALAEWLRFQSVHMQGAHGELIASGEQVRWTYYVDEPGALGTRQKVAQAVGLSCNIIRGLAGSNWSPRRVHMVQSPPRDPTEFRRVLRAPVLFNQDADFIEIPAVTLGRPIEHSNPELRKLLDRYLLDMQSGVAHDRGEQTRTAIRACLSRQDCTIEEVAGMLSVSTRTLQRQLKSRGTSFSQLLEDVRIETAQRHLANSQLSLTQLAAILGYSELSAFSRAFRRHCGVSPQKWQVASARRSSANAGPERH